MVARAASAIPDDGRHALEPKFDGARCIAFHTGARVRLQSRQQRALRAFPDVAAAVAAQVPAGTVLDGELLVLTGARGDFAALQRRLASGHANEPAWLVAFDLLADRGQDVRGLPYTERRRRLERLLTSARDGLTLAPMTVHVEGARTWLSEQTAGRGIEGVVAKRLDHGYRPGLRSWVKVKTRMSVEGVVGGVVGPLDAPRALILGRYDRRGRLRVIGKTHPLPATVDFADLFRASAAGVHPWPTPLLASRFGLPGTTDPVEHTPVAPEVVVELEVDTAYEHGRFRHGAKYLRTRTELRATDLSRWPE